jgi:DHA3 family tetracycline resistance protein-like MFS transporter
MLIGLCVAFIGLPIAVPALLMASLVIGACNTSLGLAWVNTLQEFVPSDLMGRVTSVDYLGSYLLLPLGYGIGGWAASRIGAPAVFVVGGLTQSLLIALGLLHPKVRTVD